MNELKLRDDVLDKPAYEPVVDPLISVWLWIRTL